ncbi:hypothetical protein D3C76_1463480 [compost metagenome]
MGDGGEHLGAVFDEMPQLRLHGIESQDRLANFMGPDRLDGRCPEIQAKVPRAVGELLQRLGQTASGDQRHKACGQQHHQDYDQVARPLFQPPAARRYTEHQPGLIGQLHHQGIVPILLRPVFGLIGLEPPHGEPLLGYW